MGGKGEFKTYKQRGEWVELQFMTDAAERGFNVSKPWGDSTRYDVSVEHEGRFRRVQVKSTSVPRGEGGYVCYLKRTGIRYYTVAEVDFFAIYVLEKKVWFIMPSRVVLRLKSNIRVAPGNKKQKYARYEAAWHLLRKSGRREMPSVPIREGRSKTGEGRAREGHGGRIRR
jgi:PD-(D/E)XK endonuclease